MLEQALRKLVAVLLVVVCPSSLLIAERPSAMLYATGTVTLNGMPAAKSMSVFAGDRIDTADASVVSVNRSCAYQKLIIAELIALSAIWQ